MSSIGQIISEAADVARDVQPKLARLKKATEDFEAVFMKNLLATMRKGVKEVSFGDSLGADMYRDLMDQALAESASKSGSLGIAKMMFKQMAPLAIAQEQASLQLKAAHSAVDTKA